MPLHWNQPSQNLARTPHSPMPGVPPAGPGLSALFRGLWQKTRGKAPLPAFCLIAALLVACTALPALAQAPASDQAPLDPTLGITTLRLWPGQAPGAKGDAAADIPTLTVFRPQHPNGTAVIVVPGGAYIMLAANHEGRQEADTLAEWGVTTFVLKYRIGPTYLYPVPLEDSRRAVRLVRSLAATYGYSPDRIGVMGFSAGGHLTAMTAVVPDPGKPADPDPVNRVSAALNFQILVYPWLNAMEPQQPSPADHSKLLINYCSVTKGLTQADCERLNREYTPVNHVGPTTPAAFIAATTDDNTVPVTTSVNFYSAMHAQGADAELHLFAHGPHGFGTGAPNLVLEQWLPLLQNWMRARGLLTSATATP